jgi:multidrug efflux pump subunit AcrA (membrane-fusion protein)
MSARNRFFILLGIIFVIAAIYYTLSSDHSKDLVLIGTVDANQVIVSAQVEGRIQKLLVDEGTPVKAGDLIAVLDPSELQAQEAAAAANIASLRHKVAEMQHTERSTSGFDIERRGQCAGQTIVGAGATVAGPGHARPHGERQPAHWWHWPKPASHPTRSGCRRKPICKPRRPRCRHNRTW